MFKRFFELFVFIAFGLLVSLTYAGDKFLLSGEVTFQYDGDIYVCLCTMEGWRDFQTPGYLLSQLNCKVTKMNSDIKSAGTVPFRFNNVPRGTYCIIAYQDVNNNGRVDFENYMINEPWGSFREGDPGIFSTWDMIRFDLEKNITGIEINM